MRRIMWPFGPLLAALSPGTTGAAPAPVATEIAQTYVGPHAMVDVEPGRRLNLLCKGQGKQTVLFDSGGSDWSAIWALVQPAVAAKARACTYDRAGLGYSDPGPQPRSPIAIAEDLHRLVKASGMQTPLVLVGHSLGGFNAKLYAALYPDDVAALVLVDPAEERSWDRTRSLVEARFGKELAARAELTDSFWLTRLVERYRDCGDEASPAGLDPASSTYRRCTDPPRPPLGPLIAAERQRLQVTARYQSAQASEIISSIYGDQRDDPVYARLFQPGMFADKPLIVLTRGNYDAADPLDALSQFQGVTLHRQTAALSRVGVQRTVPDSNHNIELDHPEAIVSAIAEILEHLNKAGH